MTRYLIAKANRTARSFVCKHDNYQEHWILVAGHDDCKQACILRDIENGDRPSSDGIDIWDIEADNLLRLARKETR